MDASKLEVYLISGDNGKSWTTQWLSRADVIWHLEHGYMLKKL